jgi:hypothetical protein
MNDAAGVVRRANAATAEQILRFAAIYQMGTARFWFLDANSLSSTFKAKGALTSGK